MDKRHMNRIDFTIVWYHEHRSMHVYHDQQKITPKKPPRCFMVFQKTTTFAQPPRQEVGPELSTRLLPDRGDHDEAPLGARASRCF